MSIEEWWPKLAPATREWLIAHNGESLPSDVASAISAAGDLPDPAAATRQGVAAGLGLPDEDVDWIEAAGNDENPAGS